MNDSTLVSDNQAALLDAQASAAALAERYQQAMLHCQRNSQLSATLHDRQQALQTLAGALHAFIQKRGLLPKDSHNEREDLAQLFDTLRSLVDDEQHQRLRQALGEQEQLLSEQLTAISPREDEVAAIEAAIEACDRARASLR